MEHSELGECLWLVKNGVPFDVSFSLEPYERLAYCVTFGEFEGNKWDWQAMAWQKRD